MGAFTAALAVLGLTKAQLLARADLADILKYHVLSGKIESNDLQATQTVDTMLGQPVTITKGTNGVKFADAEVMVADVLASNGVIHGISNVVLPPAAATPAPTEETPDCRTCTEDDLCYKDVHWAIVHGIRLLVKYCITYRSPLLKRGTSSLPVLARTPINGRVDCPRPLYSSCNAANHLYIVQFSHLDRHRQCALQVGL